MRRHIFSIFDIRTEVTAKVGTILLIQRSTTSEHRIAYNAKCHEDKLFDHPLLHVYHNKSLFMYTSLTYPEMEGSRRRSITNFDEVHGVLVTEFGQRLHAFNPEKFSYPDQVRAFAGAAALVGQHGAAMMMNGYMSPGGFVVEFHPILTTVTQVIARAAGLRHIVAGGSLHRAGTFSEIHIELEPGAVVNLIRKNLLQR